jgi:hypothetical protein
MARSWGTGSNFPNFPNFPGIRNGGKFAAGGVRHTQTDPLLDARRDEPYHQPNLPDG